MTSPESSEQRDENISEAQRNPCSGYTASIDHIREAEYPLLRDTTYLDHAGTTLYARSLIEAFTKDLTNNLFGNPHSASASSQLSTRRVDDTRLQVLHFLNASPEDFDVVFVANATAAIKLVADAFRDNDPGFWYGYHAEAHTSLVGVRELATEGSRCFGSDEEIGDWISVLRNFHQESPQCVRLFAYPGQSNMTGHRPPFAWCKELREVGKMIGRQVYTLYDAAALLSTSPLDLSNVDGAPDFTALSFYKIFGFPDLGALIVRKASGHILRKRKYFGGGTVEMVTTVDDPWDVKKEGTLHSSLEDGTIPFHSVVALQSAISIHVRLFGTMDVVSKHCWYLASRMYRDLSSLRHPNGAKVCNVYCNSSAFENTELQGPIIAFNILDSNANPVGYSEVEKLAIIKGIQLRTGSFCNPGGTAAHLKLSSKEIARNFAAGQRCGDDHDLIEGKPTGAIRISFGAMSNLTDVRRFLDFVKEYYVDKPRVEATGRPAVHNSCETGSQRFFVEGLSVYPIKSCAAFKVPPHTPWEVKMKGLAWDREWCLVHQGTLVSLSQKRYPRMALLRPQFDLNRRKLQVAHDLSGTSRNLLEVSLDQPSWLGNDRGGSSQSTNRPSNICGDQIDVELYTSVEVSSFFTEALDVPCTLARYLSSGPVRLSRPRLPGNLLGKTIPRVERSIMLSNESPILLVSRSSVNRLNEQIKQNGSVGKAVAADSFRGNIIIAEDLQRGEGESPYVEEEWHSLRIGQDEENRFEIMGPCQRCQMVCVDQKSAQRRQEPFSTLAKTRRKEGKVWFGMHLCLAQTVEDERRSYITIGDKVRTT